MDLSDFDYDLPGELVAQRPLEDRAGSRMLVLYRGERRWEDRLFRDLPPFLGSGDCLVVNDSKVFRSRLYGHRAGARALPVGKKNPARKQHLTGTVEVFLLRPHADNPRLWQALVHPGRKMQVGERVRFEGLEAEIVARAAWGERTLRFDYQGDLMEKFNQIGHVPLPPYIKRSDEPLDRERYQTVFAAQPGSVAAPTAGLHFTSETLEACRAAGADVARVTLHVGLGTFQPIRAERIEDHRIHSEFFEITEENAGRMRAASRLVAVGTTSVRALETAALPPEGITASRGETGLYIYPGFPFRAAGALLTNFHLPRSSLLLLVCAFAGADFVLAAYRHAVESRYRFYSYGDCMLIL